MSIHEVMRGSDPIEAQTFARLEANKKISAALAADIEAFLSSGGKVTQCDPCIESEVAIIKNEFTGLNESDTRAQKRAKAAQNAVKSSMNSKFNPTNYKSVFKSDADPDKFVVIIGSHISKLFVTVAKAVNYRDMYNKKIGRS